MVRAIDRVMGSVVNIHSERPGESPRPIQGMGTGIVIDPRGYIVTNHHVIDDVTLLRCRLEDGKTHMAMVLARNAETDLALIKIDPAGISLPIMPLGTAADLMLGETVVAIGNAFGYEGTASMGIVSAVKRDVNLNPGHALQVADPDRRQHQPRQLGRPAHQRARRADRRQCGHPRQGPGHRLRHSGRQHDPLGGRHAACRAAGPTTAWSPTTAWTTGRHGPVRSVVVKHVDSNSPASAAGLEVGDVVQQMGDVLIQCSYDVERAVPWIASSTTSCRSWSAAATRSSASRWCCRRTSAWPSSAIATDMVWTRLGIKLVPVAVDQLSQDNKQLHGGLAVTALNGDGVAAKAGIRKGDILVGLHHWETVSIENVTFVLTHPELASFSPLTFHILRTGQVRKGAFPVMGN